MKYKFTPISSNAKTGPIPTSMTEKASCPDTCPLKLNGCYAENFPLSLHWNKVTSNGISINELASKLDRLPIGQLWRHNVAGDLPHNNGAIDLDSITPILKSVKRRKLQTIVYTHHKAESNYAQLMELKQSGININVSTESIEKALSVNRMGLNAVCIMPNGAQKVTKYFNGATEELEAKIVICPAQTRDKVTCSSCGLCAKDRTKDKVIIGFLPHGARSKSVNKVIGDI